MDSPKKVDVWLKIKASKKYILCVWVCVCVYVCVCIYIYMYIYIYIYI